MKPVERIEKNENMVQLRQYLEQLHSHILLNMSSKFFLLLLFCIDFITWIYLPELFKNQSIPFFHLPLIGGSAG